MFNVMEQARMLAAQAWCGEKTSSKIMDVDLCEEFARLLAPELEKARKWDRVVEIASKVSPADLEPFLREQLRHIVETVAGKEDRDDQRTSN